MMNRKIESRKIKPAKGRRKISPPEPVPANTAPLRALLVEDSAMDAELVARELRRAGFDPVWKRVETAEALSAALDEGPWDIVISDYRMPRFDGLAAFSLVRAKDADLPFIIVSGTIGEETAVAAMKAGVQDYLMKDGLNRLGPVVRRDLAEAETRRERKRLEEATSAASRQWRATFDALREAIFLLDREGRILRCNKAFRDIVQKPFQDVIGRPCHEVVHGASQFIPDCPFIKMKESRIRETMTISRNGRWHQLTADPVWDEEDQLLFAVHVMADITDARRAEEDLRQSAERIQNLYDHAPCGYHSLDKDGLFVEINETELGWLDYTREELVGKKAFADISTAAGRAKFKKTFPLLQKGSLVANLETELIRKDGTVLPVLLNSSSVRDDQGRFVMSRSTVYDRTELQKAESALRESESRFRELFNNMKSGVVIYEAVADGADFLIKDFNTGAERIEKIPRTSVVGRKVTDAFPGVGVFGLLEVLRRVRRTGTPEYFPPGRYKDERHAGWRENYIYRIPTGEIVAIYDDVTERMETLESLRESEAKYRELADSLPIAVYEADLEGRMTFINRTGVELSGYSESEFLSGFSVSEFLVESDRPRAASTIGRILASGKPSSGEYSARRKDGTAFPVHVVSTPVIKDGRPAGLRGIVIDISERKRAEDEKRSWEAGLRQQQKLESIGTLAGGVAHEINNPINGIMNYAQLILDSLTAESPLRVHAEEILRETDRVANIVGSLLTFARQDKQTHSPAAIGDIVESPLRLVRTVLRRDQIILEVNIPPDLPRINCRSQQIQQVVMNLITNARDALNERFPGADDDKRIVLRASEFERDGRRWIRMTVEDHGAGIPEAVRDRIFEPFFTTKPRDHGTGLGLSISHGIVRDHHGEMHFETEVGRGTRFHVDLPEEIGWALEPPDGGPGRA
jgi:PAS domain S-box-containing protein